MKAIVHIGMHKTGTSSIQASFAAKAPLGMAYLTSNGTNLNGWARLMFEGDAQVAQLVAMRTANAETIQHKRAETAQKTTAFLAASPEKQIILSAERFTYMDLPAVKAFRHWLAERFEQVTVYAYVREPMGFVRSSFQQRAKSLADPGDFSLDLPKYRMRFEKYESSFGRENLHYRLFRPTQLVGGDVVRDFADWIGTSYAIPDILRENESLSVEALGVLAALRQHYRPAKDGPVNPGLLKRLITTLQDRPTTKWSLSDIAQNSIRAQIEQDADWMDSRLSQALDRSDKAEHITITHPLDLLNVDAKGLTGLRDAIRLAFAQPGANVNLVLQQVLAQGIS